MRNPPISNLGSIYDPLIPPTPPKAPLPKALHTYEPKWQRPFKVVNALCVPFGCPLGVPWVAVGALWCPTGPFSALECPLPFENPSVPCHALRGLFSAL